MSTLLCPNGHATSMTDYCDVCGAPMGGAAASPPAAPAGTAAEPATPAPAASPVTPASSPSVGPPIACPNCGTENAADALFCEDCGYDFTTGQKPVAEVPLEPAPMTPIEPGWEVEIIADRDWYAVKATADTDPFPTDQVPQTVAITGHVAMIGRESASRGIHPDIDAGTDAAVSRRHAQLVHSGDTWQIVDLGSTNGTTLAPAGEPPAIDPLPSGQPHVVNDGDSVMVGAWTRITLRHVAEPGAGAP